MKSKLVGWLSFAVAIVVLVALAAWVNVGELFSLLVRANVAIVLFAAFFSLAALAARALRWKLLLDESKVLPFSDVFAVQAAGLALSNFSPGRVLEVAKVLPLKARGVRYSFALLSVVWERVLDLLVLFLFSSLALAQLAPGEDIAFLLLFFLLLVVLYSLHSFAPSILVWASQLRPLDFLKKVEVHRFRPGTITTSFLVSLVAWTLDYTAVFLAFRALGLTVDYFVLAAAFSLSVAVGLISLLPGGLGATEASLVFLLSPTGLPAASLFAGTVLARVATLGVSSLVGAFLVPVAGRHVAAEVGVEKKKAGKARKVRGARRRRA